MSKAKKILLAIDFDETTAVAVDKACYLSKSRSEMIIPMHAIEIANLYSNSPAIDMEAIYSSARTRLNDIKDSIVSKGAMVFEPVFRNGPASDAILTVADELDVGLIVIGARQKSLLERVLGSTAENVVRKAIHPVFIVHPNDSVHEIDDIVCAVDCSPGSIGTLDNAIQICRQVEAKLKVLHAIPTRGYAPGLGELRAPISEWDMEVVSESVSDWENRSAEVDKQEEARVVEFLEKFDFSNLTYSYELVHGNTEEKIVSHREKFGMPITCSGCY